MKDRASIKRMLQGLLLTAASLIFLFVVGEVTMRLLTHRRPSTTMFQKLEHSPRLVGLIPHYEGMRNGVRVRINAAGFRDREFSEKKKKNVFRIIGLGDSVTFGAGVQIEDTYLKQLETMLNKASLQRNFEVLNMGVPAYNTYQESIYLKEKGLQYQPDLLILGFVLNDIDVLNPNWTKDRELDSPRQFRNSVVRDSEPRIFSLYRYLKNKSQLLYFLLMRVSALAKKYDLPIETESIYYRDAYKDGNEGWKIATDSLRDIAAIGKKNGCPLLVVIFPFFVNLDDSYMWAEAHSAIVSFCKREGIRVIDLFPYFKGRDGSEFWISLTDSHPNAEAHRIVAQAIYEEIKKIIE